MAELKKCPFCGGEMEILNVSESPLYVHDYIFDCKNHCIHSVRSFMTEDEAIKACNKRATEEEIRAKAIDEFAERMKYEYGSDEIHETIDEIAEQMKGGAEC